MANIVLVYMCYVIRYFSPPGEVEVCGMAINEETRTTEHAVSISMKSTKAQTVNETHFNVTEFRHKPTLRAMIDVAETSVSNVAVLEFGNTSITPTMPGPTTTIAIGLSSQEEQRTLESLHTDTNTKEINSATVESTDDSNFIVSESSDKLTVTDIHDSASTPKILMKSTKDQNVNETHKNVTEIRPKPTLRTMIDVGKTSTSNVDVLESGNRSIAPTMQGPTTTLAIRLRSEEERSTLETLHTDTNYKEINIATIQSTNDSNFNVSESSNISTVPEMHKSASTPKIGNIIAEEESTSGMDHRDINAMPTKSIKAKSITDSSFNVSKSGNILQLPISQKAAATVTIDTRSVVEHNTLKVDNKGTYSMQNDSNRVKHSNEKPFNATQSDSISIPPKIQDSSATITTGMESTMQPTTLEVNYIYANVTQMKITNDEYINKSNSIVSDSGHTSSPSSIPTVAKSISISTTRVVELASLEVDHKDTDSIQRIGHSAESANESTSHVTASGQFLFGSSLFRPQSTETMMATGIINL